MADNQGTFGQRLGHALEQQLDDRPLMWGAAAALILFPNTLLGALRLYPAPEEWPNVLLAMAFVTPLVFVFAKPELTMFLSVPPAVVQGCISYELTFGNVVPLLGLCAIAALRQWRPTVCWACATLLAFAAHRWASRLKYWLALDPAERAPKTVVDWTTDVFPELIAWVVPVGFAALLGRVVQMQKQRFLVERQKAAQLERDRALTMELAIAQERSRIAADVHDILAHSLAVIAVQTDAAAHLLKHDPAAASSAREAVEAAHDAAVIALRETRTLAHAIDSPVEEHAPQPTLGQLPDLVRSCDPTGARFNLVSEVDLDRVELGPSSHVALYRIVQEALTNVLRHASEDARAQVVVSEVPGHLRVEILNDGPTISIDDSRGNGLSNMAQRARSVGGEYAAGPRPGGGFAVVAQVPFLASEVAP
ncbi:sensor histidine kinase [Corynebacterium aquatimens]|uniref:histidine kinase n=1 Tax=Corynebacterium aquatimens TaxID=1190508 RepID=A0A931GRM0_9CORY|nr:histidine kinase [Corynebacterium aquatimens]MBG6122128.1 signal transduction histidine kinase [Corynebacterium aquatimens]WJY65331.1 Sensor histidine kinase LiaS [Corynebacterium aquatimens]